MQLSGLIIQNSLYETIYIIKHYKGKPKYHIRVYNGLAQTVCVQVFPGITSSGCLS